MTDKDIRDLMLNAEEKVPSRVWSNIRSKISPAPSNWVWVWGLALACIVAIALILPISIKHERISPTVQMAKKIVVDSSEETTELQIPDGLLAQAVTAQPEPSFAAKAIVATPEAEPELQQSTEKSADVPIVTSVEPSSETCAEVATKTASKTVQKSIAEIDAFARMEMEENRKEVHNLSITANSTVSGNDSDFFGESSTIYRSSSAGIKANTGIIETGPSVYSIPVTFGIGIRHSFNEKVSIGSGLTYSLLTRTFTGNYNTITGVDIRHNMQYLGIPVNVYYSIVGNKVVDFHVFGGGSLEFCVSNSYRIGQTGTLLRDPVSGVQASAAIGFGAAFRLTDFLSICIDPSARYYFRSSHPKSLRTDKPLMINLELGLKFDL